MDELNDFYNDGFGWICRHCERDSRVKQGISADKPPRLFREGEADTGDLARGAMAKWADKTRQILTCPRCGVTERAEKS